MADKTFAAKDMDVSTMVRNILGVWAERVETLSPAEFAQVVSWYSTAFSWCADVAKVYALPVKAVAGIVAALSPQLSWEKNKSQALRFLSYFSEGKPYAGFMAYPANLNKAHKIALGSEPLEVLGGDKVRNFYANILLDSEAVTVDRHAISIALFGLQTKKSGALTVTSKGYSIAAGAYREAAKIVGVKPSIVQAVTWTYKAQNGGFSIRSERE